MGLRDDIPTLVQLFKDLKPRLEHNHILFNIYEGDLLRYVLCDLKEQLSDDQFNQIRFRVAPINTLKRLIDKLSKIYAKAPKRELVQGNFFAAPKGSEPLSEKDQNLFRFYEETLKLSVVLAQANEFFNLFKYTWIEPYLDNGIPALRCVPSDRFFVYSNDPVDPLKPTHFVKVLGKVKDALGQEKVLFHGYTAQEFVAFDDSGNVIAAEMARVYGDADPAHYGTNPLGRLPGVYISRSKNELIPQPDTDLLQMVKLIPVLLSDLNLAAMFQCFSIIYGINLDEENLKLGPNAFWRFKSDPAQPDNKPEVGVIKPEVDIDKVLGLIGNQLAFWLNSRNIRPGTIGALTTESYTSGVSKIIDEMDTSEDRAAQIPYFVDAEGSLLDLIMYSAHPYWVGNPSFPVKVAFTPGLRLQTTFPEQRAALDQSKLIDDQIKLLTAGLETRRGALKTLNPELSETQLDEKVLELLGQATMAPLPSSPPTNPQMESEIATDEAVAIS
jgi:hypothetical protein